MTSATITERQRSPTHRRGDHERCGPDPSLAAMTAVIAGVSGAGSLIGGLLTDLVGWRAVMALPALVLLALPAAIRLALSTPWDRAGSTCAERPLSP